MFLLYIITLHKPPFCPHTMHPAPNTLPATSATLLLHITSTSICRPRPIATPSVAAPCLDQVHMAQLQNPKGEHPKGDTYSVLCTQNACFPLVS
jgi:hypothetical protein